MIKTISIIIPAFNEGPTIKRVVDRVSNLSLPQLKKQIIVIDDGSTDGTANILKRIKKKGIIKLFHKKNRGKGAALKTGFKAANGDVTIIQDADLEYNPDEIKYVIEPITQGIADVVYGSRFVGNRPHRVLYFWHSIGNNLLTFLSNILTNLNLSDMETGYKAFTKDVIKKITPLLQSDRFGFEPEVTARVAKLARDKNIRIYEVGVSYTGRTYKEGKKINWKDGLAALWYLFKYNLLE